MKTKLIAIISLAMSMTGFSQNYTPSWHIVQPNAQYYIVNGCLQSATDTSDMVFTGSVVLVFDFINGNYLSYDPYGRVIAFKGQGSLLKAPITPQCGIGIMKTTKQLMDGTDVDEGSYVWITSWDAKKVITIQENKTVDLSDSDIELLPFRKDARTALYKAVTTN